jgi:hypothetical protein
MTSAEVQTLIDSVPCDLCNMDPGLVPYAILAALIDVSNGDSVPATTQGLITEANCLICLVPPGLVPFLTIQAIRGITAGGGGGGGDQQVYTGAAPPAAPDNPALPAVFYPTGGGALLQWDGAAWV